MDYPFTTDGCSGGMSAIWRTIFGTKTPWEGGCVRHDRRYWRGGTREERAVADRRLLLFVWGRGYPTVAIVMYLAVRVGGHPFLPTSWRWGYGWRYPRGYRAQSVSHETSRAVVNRSGVS